MGENSTNVEKDQPTSKHYNVIIRILAFMGIIVTVFLVQNIFPQEHVSEHSTFTNTIINSSDNTNNIDLSDKTRANHHVHNFCYLG
jgi:hypothetical protein